jgi:hypothetical protein
VAREPGLVARAGGQIVGALTLVVLPIPAGLGRGSRMSWLTTRRGCGGGLTREAVRLAREAGTRTLDMTSRPSRNATNRLYERPGFRMRGSKVYRLADGL